MNRASVHHALALARFGLGDTAGALEAENFALAFIKKDPELGAEMNAAWYLMRMQLLKGDETEVELKRLNDLRQEVLDFREANSDALIMWPVELRVLLDGVKEAQS